MLNKKTKAAIAAGLQVIFCIGELLAEREAGKTEDGAESQIRLGLGNLTAEEMAKVVIAYEPVWAIGTGKVATPEQAPGGSCVRSRSLKGHFGDAIAAATLIQYGGSVKADNAAALLSLPDVDGALVGGASLKPETFLPIVAAAGNKPGETWTQPKPMFVAMMS